MRRQLAIVVIVAVAVVIAIAVVIVIAVVVDFHFLHMKVFFQVHLRKIVKEGKFNFWKSLTVVDYVFVHVFDVVVIVTIFVVVIATIVIAIAVAADTIFALEF